jgi:hypothetical protein
LMEIDLNTGGVTVNTDEPLIAPDAAMTVTLPWVMLVAKPPPLTVATAVVDEVHCAVAVRFLVDPSL